ncbi:hypothetical protein B0H19DRAFT_1069319 [Mycena capillaripes]|nr:hypothetical protein B0H19DRAFT_1069319 [Mycena capillaripes]
MPSIRLSQVEHGRWFSTLRNVETQDSDHGEVKRKYKSDMIVGEYRKEVLHGGLQAELQVTLTELIRTFTFTLPGDDDIQPCLATTLTPMTSDGQRRSEIYLWIENAPQFTHWGTHLCVGVKRNDLSSAVSFPLQTAAYRSAAHPEPALAPTVPHRRLPAKTGTDLMPFIHNNQVCSYGPGTDAVDLAHCPNPDDWNWEVLVAADTHQLALRTETEKAYHITHTQCGSEPEQTRAPRLTFLRPSPAQGSPLLV